MHREIPIKSSFNAVFSKELMIFVILKCLLQMKKIGLIGGLSPESTLSYYDGIIDGFRSTYDEKGFPEIIIDSLDLRYFTNLAQTDKWKTITEEISGRFENLKKAGAEFGAMASNTPHKVFKEISNATSLPLISIVEATKEYALRKNFTKLILLGTAFTMSSSFYQDNFEASGIKLITPSEKEQEYIHSKIFTEMVLGVFNEKTKASIKEIVGKIALENKVDGAILACTELPIMFKPTELGIYTLDPSSIHIQSIIEKCQTS